MLKIITHRSIWLNILFGIILAVGIFAIFLLSLKWITGHGKSATVPSVTGKKITDAPGACSGQKRAGSPPVEVVLGQRNLAGLPGFAAGPPTPFLRGAPQAVPPPARR